MPEPGPFGETFLDASDLAMVAASLVNNPFGGKVETVFTLAIHRPLFFLAAMISFLQLGCDLCASSSQHVHRSKWSRCSMATFAVGEGKPLS